MLNKGQEWVDISSNNLHEIVNFAKKNANVA